MFKEDSDNLADSSNFNFKEVIVKNFSNFNTFIIS